MVRGMAIDEKQMERLRVAEHILEGDVFELFSDQPGIEQAKAAGRTVEMRTLPGGALQYDDPIWRTLMPPDTTGFQSKRPRE